MRRSAKHEVGNVTVSESNGLSMICDHGRQKSIYSWHRPVDDPILLTSHVEMLLSLVHFLPLQLDRNVLDSEQTHRIVDMLERVLLSVGIAADRVRAHRHHARRDCPNVKVMH